MNNGSQTLRMVFSVSNDGGFILGLPELYSSLLLLHKEDHPAGGLLYCLALYDQLGDIFVSAPASETRGPTYIEVADNGCNCFAARCWWMDAMAEDTKAEMLRIRQD